MDFIGDATARSFEALRPRIDAESGVTPLSFVKRGVSLAQDAMGLVNGDRPEETVPTGAVVRALEDPALFVESIADTISREAEAGAVIDDQEWTKVLKSVDVDVGFVLVVVLGMLLTSMIGSIGSGVTARRWRRTRFRQASAASHGLGATAAALTVAGRLGSLACPELARIAASAG